MIHRRSYREITAYLVRDFQVTSCSDLIFHSRHEPPYLTRPFGHFQSRLSTIYRIIHVHRRVPRRAECFPALS